LCVFSIETIRVRGMWPLLQSRTAVRTCSGAKVPCRPGRPRVTSPLKTAGPPCS